jgi:hypothetical protein
VLVVVVAGALVVDSVLVSVLVLLVVDSVLVLSGTVLEMLELDELPPPPPLPAITTTATISPTMIASSAATR